MSITMTFARLCATADSQAGGLSEQGDIVADSEGFPVRPAPWHSEQRETEQLIMMKQRAQRYEEIGEAFARHGRGFIVGIAGLERWVPLHHGLLGHEPRTTPYTNPDHLRTALEELGPTFIKLGQLLSTRPDLLPPEYQSELSKLQDGMPPIPGITIRQLIRDTLGASPEDLFAQFGAEPLASASIGQAHAATLRDGTPVVVKVRRPDIVPTIEADLDILQNLAARISRRWEAAANSNLIGITDEFAQTLRAELDYLQEGRNAERFAANFAADPGVHIPRVFWETTTSRVLTLERITGTKVNDPDALDAAGIDRRALARLAARTVVRMGSDDGFFHADPHPGNLFIEPGGRIGLIDFGMIGEVTDKLGDQLGVLLTALTRSDPDRLASALLDLSITQSSVDRRQFRADLTRFIALYDGRQLGGCRNGAWLWRIRSALRGKPADGRVGHVRRPSGPRRGRAARWAGALLAAAGLPVMLAGCAGANQCLSPQPALRHGEQFTVGVFEPRAGRIGAHREGTLVVHEDGGVWPCDTPPPPAAGPRWWPSPWAAKASSCRRPAESMAPASC